MKKSILIACALFLVVVGFAHAEYDGSDERCIAMQSSINFNIVRRLYYPLTEKDTMIFWFGPTAISYTGAKKNGHVNFVGAYAKHCLNLKFFEWRESYDGKLIKRADLTTLDLPLISYESAKRLNETFKKFHQADKELK